MRNILSIICFAAAILISVLDFPDSAVAVLITAVFSVLTIVSIRHFLPEEADYLTNVFLVALLARMIFGTFIHSFDLRNYFGGDANTYDAFGSTLARIWAGEALSENGLKLNNSGWGMPYLVAAIYSLVGRNIFAAQCFCGVIGAATTPLVYNCAYQIFGNRRVSKISALVIAVYPAFIIWSGQLLKDGLIIFLLVLTITMVMQVQKKFSYAAVIIIILALFGILSLRFYIFYMVAVAVVGSFIIGFSNSPQSIFRRLVVLVAVGFGLTYIGVLRNAEKDIGEYANLQRIQQSRNDLTRAGSGFGQDIDVSTTEGALSAMPIGFAYLMLAPFPWQITGFSQLMVLPDTLMWWLMLPFTVSGIWFAMKHRLRTSIGVLIFSLMLVLAYSIFQGNVGMAYRQRTQIQVFLFMFSVVGWTLVQERKENRKTLLIARKREQINKQSIQANVQ